MLSGLNFYRLRNEKFLLFGLVIFFSNTHEEVNKTAKACRDNMSSKTFSKICQHVVHLFIVYCIKNFKSNTFFNSFKTTFYVQFYENPKC